MIAQTKAKMSNLTLNHTIFLIGWGVDKKTGMKYWIVRNSYGDEWGLNGDFLVRRGFNDFGVEDELSSFHIELLI